jgi:hypothetical protein
VVKKTLQQCWGVFFKRLSSERIWHLSIVQRISELNRYVLPLLRYRASGWPPFKKISDMIDSVQTRMIGHLLRVSPWPDEPIDKFFRRRSKAASALAEHTGRWSLSHCARFVKWHEHCLRNSSGLAFNAELLKYKDNEWLERRREQYVPVFSISGNCFTKWAGRTNTRSTRGPPPVRWESAYHYAKAELEYAPTRKKYTGDPANKFLPAEIKEHRFSNS